MARKRSGDGRLSPETRKQLSHIQACEKSGETLKSYAARHGLRVHSLYHAKRLAREHGILPPHRGRKAEPSLPRNSKPRRFVEAILRTDALEGGATWRVRFPSGVVLESSAPLAIAEALQLIERLGGAP
jgi:transposase-like protein